MAYRIYSNIYFDPIYLQLFLVILIVYFVAVILLSYYLIAPESINSRSVIPWGFLMASIASFLIFIWVTVYIFFVYSKDSKYVLVTKFDEDAGGHKERRKRERSNDEAKERGEDPQDDIDPEYSH